MSSIVSTENGSTSTLTSTAFTFLLRMGTVGVGLGIVLGTILYYKQESLLYFPEIGGVPRSPSRNPRGYRSPEERQIPFESYMIPCSDGIRIHAWLLLHENRRNAPTIVFFHGNAGNIGLRIPNAMQMMEYLHVNVLMVEYRGYGDSDDREAPSEAGLRKDAEAALQFCQNHPHIDPNNLFVFGRSLGGAVAFHLADYAQKMRIPIAGLIIENTFTSISAMVDQLLPYLSPFKALVLRMHWDSTQIVPHVDIPTLYLAGQRDELVPHAHMKHLFALQSSNSNSNSNGNIKAGKKRLVQWHVVRNGTHNETWLRGGPAYWNAMRQFIAQAAAYQAADPSRAASTTGDHDAMAQCPVAEEGFANMSNTGSSNTAIPTMSSRLWDMARAQPMPSSSSSSSTDDKKKE